ncbi:MAG: hypothetical protein ACHQFW_07010 [Chitinophagales bacterium]
MINTKLKLNSAKNNLWIGYDHLSGDNDTNEHDQCFNTLYATNHKFYGNMDYYLNIPKDTYNDGLRDIYAGAKFMLGSRSSIQVEAHQFYLNNEIIVSDPEIKTYNKNLGFESDVAFTFVIMNDVKLLAGQSIYIPTSTTAFVKSVEDAQPSFWTYLSLNITPQIFQSK